MRSPGLCSVPGTNEGLAVTGEMDTEESAISHTGTHGILPKSCDYYVTMRPRPRSYPP